MAAMESSCSDSPETSISYDFGPPVTVASVEKKTLQSRSVSNVNSEFCFQSNNDDQANSPAVAADELFFDGKILPVQINERIDNVSSKQMLKPIVVKKPFPPLQAYVRANNSDNSLAVSVKIKKISGTKQMQSKPLTPLRELLIGDEAPKRKSSFKVKTGAVDGGEQRRQDSKPMRRSANCCGLKRSGNGGFRGGFCPFPLLFRNFSVGFVQNSLKINVSSSPRKGEKHLQNSIKSKERRSTSLVRHESPSLKQLILADRKLHNSLPIRSKKPSLKQLIVRDYLME